MQIHAHTNTASDMEFVFSFEKWEPIARLRSQLLQSGIFRDVGKEVRKIMVVKMLSKSRFVYHRASGQ